MQKFATLLLAGALVVASNGIAMTQARAAVALPSAARTATAVWAGNLTCPHGANYGSIACFYDAVQYGDYTEFHNNTMTMNSTYEAAGYHINQSLWAFSGGGCTTYWVEAGITQGYHGQIVYTWYHARNSSAGYADYKSATTSPDGSNHSYELDYIGNASYNVYRDGQVLNGVSGLGFGTCIAAAGLEESKNVTPNGGYRADTTDPTPLRWTDTSGFIHYGWNINEWYIDYPCGQGQNPPNCFNGLYYGSNHWSDNKPLT